MAALAALQKQVSELKNAIYYLTEKLGAGAGEAAAPGAPPADVVTALEAVSAELKETSSSLKALGDQVGYVARISSDGFASLKGVADKIAAVPTPQQVNALGEKIDSIAESIPSPQHVSEVAKKVDAVAEKVGYVARQASDLSAKLEAASTRLGEAAQNAAKAAEASVSVAALANQVGELASRARVIESAEETQRKQAELLSEALALMNKELGTARTSYSELSKKIDSMPTGQQIERLIETTVKMTEVQAAQEKQLAAAAELLSTVSKKLAEGQQAKAVQQLSEQLNKLSAQTTRLAESADVQRRQSEIMASALNTLVKEVAEIEKRTAAIPSPAEIEKRVFSKLAEKMGGA